MFIESYLISVLNSGLAAF